MTTDLFTNQEDPNQIDKDPLEVLTGPGGKFDRSKYESDADMYRAIAKGKLEADVFIEHKNKEYDILREDYLKERELNTAKGNLMTLVDQLKGTGQQEETGTTQNQQTLAPELNLEEVAAKVSEMQRAEAQKRRQEENLRLVKAKLTETWGVNYPALLQERIETLGLTKEFVNELAEKHPTVLFKTLELDVKKNEQFQAPPRSGTRSDNFAPSASTNKRTWSYYEKMRKEDPKRYSDPQTQVQKIKDSVELGAAFRDWKD